MRFHKTIETVIMIIFSSGVYAQIPDNKNLIFFIDSLAKDALKKGPLASISIGVKKDGDVIFEKAYGFANVQLSVPATIHSVYPLASVSKMFTAICILQLAEQRKLSINDNIGKWLDGYDTIKRNITIRNLLSHSSGIRDYGQSDSFQILYKSFSVTPQQLIELGKNAPLNFAPGTNYSYSNTGFDILALIAEKASGERLPDYIRKHIAEPAGLSQTSLSLMQNIIPQQVAYYDVNNDTLYRADEWGNIGYGAGLIQSTIDDLLKFQDALNKNILIKPGSLQQMRAPLVIDDQAYSYGFGTRIKFYPAHTGYGHTGSGGGATSSLRYFPADDLTIAVLSNTENDNDPAFPSAQIIGGIIAKRIFNIPTSDIADLPLPKNEINTYTGEWVSGRGNMMIVEKAGHLWIHRLNRPDSARLLYQGYHKFALEGNTLNVFDFKMKDGIAELVNNYYDYDLAGTARRKKVSR